MVTEKSNDKLLVNFSCTRGWPKWGNCYASSTRRPLDWGCSNAAGLHKQTRNKQQTSLSQMPQLFKLQSFISFSAFLRYHLYKNLGSGSCRGVLPTALARCSLILRHACGSTFSHFNTMNGSSKSLSTPSTAIEIHPTPACSCIDGPWRSAFILYIRASSSTCATPVVPPRVQTPHSPSIGHTCLGSYLPFFHLWRPPGTSWDLFPFHSSHISIFPTSNPFSQGGQGSFKNTGLTHLFFGKSMSFSDPQM